MTNQFADRIEGAYELLAEKSTTPAKVRSLHKLLKGINPRIDSTLSTLDKELTRVEKFQKGEFIELSAEMLPENNQTQKDRKKALLLFLKQWKKLTGEVERVQAELSANNARAAKSNWQKSARIITGYQGIATLIALAIVGGLIVINRQPKKPVVSQSIPVSQKSSAIMVGDKTVLLRELVTGSGPECDGQHYHAMDHIAAKATDGTTITDPGGCGFGKVSDTKIIEVN